MELGFNHSVVYKKIKGNRGESDMRRKLFYKQLYMAFKKRCSSRFFEDNLELFEILITDLLEEQEYYELLQKPDVEMKERFEIAKLRDKVIRRIQTGFKILNLRSLDNDEEREKEFQKIVDEVPLNE